MEQLIRHVTTSITDQLSDDKSYFTPDDLREYDIPEFLVRRVEVEIYRNLNESIVPPHSEWADMAAKNVERAWEQFIDAIVAEVRMPASFIPSVFETAVADVLEMILQPRQAIPSILFGPKKKLSAEELEKRLSFITVNSHLGQAIQKYMARKGKEEIELGTAKNIVIKVDERITANYNSLNWTQLLQPLFILAGSRVDTEMFRIFFKDRGMDRISRRFDLLNGSLNKTEFIETLSSPDLLNEEGYEEDQVSLFDVESESDRGPESKQKDTQARPEKVKKETNSTEVQNIEVDSVSDEEHADEEITNEKPDADTPEQTDSGEVRDDEDSLLGSFQNRHRKSGYSQDEVADEDDEDSQTDAPWFVNEEDQDDDSDDTPLYSRFDTDADEVTEKDEEEPEDRFADRFLYDDEEESMEESMEESEEELSVLFQSAKKTENEDEDYVFSLDEDNELQDETNSEADEFSMKDLSESDDDSPIWQSFLGDDDHLEKDDIPEYSGFADLEKSNEDESAEEEPLIDLTTLENDFDSAQELISWLKDDEQRFIEHIFKGSDAAYEQALVDLNAFDNWKQASRFIEKEIFARNLVDMYDEEAVDFTDRLQAYFDEFKS